MGFFTAIRIAKDAGNPSQPGKVPGRPGALHLNQGIRGFRSLDRKQECWNLSGLKGIAQSAPGRRGRIMKVQFLQGRMPGEMPRQGQAAPAYTALDGAWRYSKHVGHFLITHSLQITEYDCFLVFGGKTPQRLPDNPGSFCLLDFSLRAWLASILDMHLLELQAAAAVPKPAALPVSVYDQVPAQPQNPVAQASRVLAKAAQVLIDLDKNILG
jgi:hypothetical protein